MGLISNGSRLTKTNFVFGLVSRDCGLLERFEGKRDLKDNKDNSLHLGRKYARIFVLGHYLFLVAHSFPRATLLENCSPLGTDNVRGQISQHIFAPNGGYCLYICTVIWTVFTTNSWIIILIAELQLQ